MIRIVHAQLLRLVRRRTLPFLLAGPALFAVVAALTVIGNATDAGTPSRRGGTTVAELADAGGGTEAFAVAASYLGLFVFVTFIALIATEFSGGTFRALLLRQPNRFRVIVGQLTGILLVAGVMVLAAEAVISALSLAIAPAEDVPTDAWLSLDGAVAAARDFATTMGGVAGWAVFGTVLALACRSAPVALAVGFAWAGPLENITVDSWSTGYEVYPGQVLASLTQGGSAELGLAQATVTALAYAAVAAGIAMLLLHRRDVTA